MTDETNEVLSEDNATQINPTEQPQNEPVTEVKNEDDYEEEKRGLLEQIDKLKAELLKEQIKVQLLVLGIIPEKLEDGAAMAYGLCLAGKSPESAADEIITAYPHLKAVRQEIPQFSSESTGSGDGFSAIRRIFSAR